MLMGASPTNFAVSLEKLLAYCCDDTLDSVSLRDSSEPIPETDPQPRTGEILIVPVLKVRMKPELSPLLLWSCA